MNIVQKVTVRILAQGAYASIYSTMPDSHLDVRLECAGHPSKSLESAADDFEKKAARFLKYARLCRESAVILREDA